MKIKNLVTAGLLLVGAGSARAANLQNELLGATNIKFDITGVDKTSRMVGDINVGYNYSVNEFLQVGGLLNYEHNTGVDSIGLYGSSTYNFGPHFADALFAEGRVGLSHVPDSTNFHLGIYGGKRFELAPHISFRPHAGFDLAFGNHSSFTFEILPVAFSFWF